MALPNDLPRKRDGWAVIGDDRNDENLVVAQTHLAFLKFHNRVIDVLPRGEEDDRRSTFTQAEETRKRTTFHNSRRTVRWHYQWLVLNDFLPRVIDPNVLDEVRTNGRRFFRFNRALRRRTIHAAGVLGRGLPLRAQHDQGDLQLQPCPIGS